MRGPSLALAERPLGKSRQLPPKSTHLARQERELREILAMVGLQDYDSAMAVRGAEFRGSGNSLHFNSLSGRS